MIRTICGLAVDGLVAVALTTWATLSSGSLPPLPQDGTLPAAADGREIGTLLSLSAGVVALAQTTQLLS